MKTAIKATLAIVFLLCLLKMPYSYFQLVRFAALVGFALLAWFAFKEKEPIQMILYIALALLFQPFNKPALGRQVWNLVDVIVAVGLLISIFMNSSKVSRKIP